MLRTLTYYFAFILLLFSIISCDKDDSNFNSEYKSLFEKAKMHYKFGEINNSHTTFLELLSMSNEVSNNIENQRINLIALNYLGQIILASGEKKLAYIEFERALQLAEKLDNEQYQIIALRNMADLEEDPTKIEETLKYIRERFEYNERNKYSLDQIKYKLGLLYSNKNDTESALKIFKELLLDDKYDNDVKSSFYESIGIVHKNTGDYKLSIDFFNKALDLVDIGTLRELEVLTEKAHVLSLLKDFDGFVEIKNKIEPLLNSIGNLKLKKRVSELQLKVYNQKNNTEGSLNTLSELLNLNEKIYKKSNASLGSIAVNLKNYELKKENLAQKALNSYLIILLSLSGLLFLLAILSFMFFHKFHKKQAELKILEKEQKVKEEQAKHKDLQNKLEIESINAFVNGQEEERKRYAMQLHDSLGANLAAVNMHLSVLKKDVPGKSYNRVSKMLKNAIEETRSISHNIMPPVLVNQGLIIAITEKAIEWDCDKLQFEVNTNTERVPINDKLEITLYRGILECINNIIRHAQASKVHISFSREQNSLQIAIKDNGQGFDMEKIKTGQGGLGINGLKLRIHYFEGDFKIQSKKGEGTMVNISVPLLAIKQTG